MAGETTAYHKPGLWVERPGWNGLYYRSGIAFSHSKLPFSIISLILQTGIFILLGLSSTRVRSESFGGDCVFIF